LILSVALEIFYHGSVSILSTHHHCMFLECILNALGDYQRIFDGQKHQRFTHALSMAYLDIIILCTEFKSLLRIQRRSSVRRVFQPLSPALNSHLDDAINRFRLHREAVDKEAGVCHMIEEKESRDLVLRNSEAAEARKRGLYRILLFPDLLLINTEAKQKDLVKRLSKVNYVYKHHRMQKIRHPGTGAWIKELPEFKNWLACKTSATMCCYGIRMFIFCHFFTVLTWLSWLREICPNIESHR
jgi:hypothetical protein